MKERSKTELKPQGSKKSYNLGFSPTALRINKESIQQFQQQHEGTKSSSTTAAHVEHILYIFADDQVVEKDTPCFKFDLNKFLQKYNLYKKRKSQPTIVENEENNAL